MSLEDSLYLAAAIIGYIVLVVFFTWSGMRNERRRFKQYHPALYNQWLVAESERRGAMKADNFRANNLR